MIHRFAPPDEDQPDAMSESSKASALVGIATTLGLAALVRIQDRIAKKAVSNIAKVHKVSPGPGLQYARHATT